MVINIFIPISDSTNLIIHDSGKVMIYQGSQGQISKIFLDTNEVKKLKKELTEKIDEEGDENG